MYKIHCKNFIVFLNSCLKDLYVFISTLENCCIFSVHIKCIRM